MGETNNALFIIMWVITFFPCYRSRLWLADGYRSVNTGDPLYLAVLLRFQEVAQPSQCFRTDSKKPT